MVLLRSQIIALTTALSFLSSLVLAQLSPGSYFIDNVGNGQRILVSIGLAQAPTIAQEGFPVITFLTEPSEILEQHIFTVNSEMNTLFNQATQQFAVVDASNGGTAGSGIILCNTTFPVPPFNPIGNSDWSFEQGSEGTM